MVRTGLLMIAILLAVVLADDVKAEGSNDTDVYQRKRIQLKKRYQGYFEHFEKKSKYAKVRRKGRDDWKKRQKAKKIEREKAREAYDPNSKRAYDTPKLELAWEKQMELVQKQKRQARQRFIESRDQLRKIEENSERVPQEAEVGFITPEELED